MLRKIRLNIPNSITCLNLLSGAVACIFSFRYAQEIGGLMGYQWAWIFIAASAIFDFCDGASARLLHGYSLLGKELDSLSDLISFGLAPALLMFNMFIVNSGGELIWWAFISLLIVVCGAIRLAKFNVDDTQIASFKGLPIPANAIFWIGYTAWVQNHLFPGYLITSLIIISLSLLMVCNLPMFSLKFSDFNIIRNFRRYILLLAGLIFVLTEGIAGLAWTIILYIIISVFGRNIARNA